MPPQTGKTRKGLAAPKYGTQALATAVALLTDDGTYRRLVLLRALRHHRPSASESHRALRALHSSG